MIAIKDFKMPDECHECPFAVYEEYYGGNTVCKADGAILAYNHKTLAYEGRHEECPLKDVPDINDGNMDRCPDSTKMTGDYISRQAAIEIVKFECGAWTGLAQTIEKSFNSLPSTQPEFAKDVNDGKCSEIPNNSDTISRQAALDAVNEIRGTMNMVADIVADKYLIIAKDNIRLLPSVQLNNQVHLCDSCKYDYPKCLSESDDVIFGNGIGNDNICACNKYKPSVQPEIIRCRNCVWSMTGYHLDRLFCSIEQGLAWIEPDSFCSYAERRTDETD